LCDILGDNDGQFISFIHHLLLRRKQCVLKKANKWCVICLPDWNNLSFHSISSLYLSRKFESVLTCFYMITNNILEVLHLERIFYKDLSLIRNKMKKDFYFTNCFLFHKLYNAQMANFLLFSEYNILFDIFFCSGYSLLKYRFQNNYHCFLYMIQ